jgi:hypothetical protein
MYLPDAGGFDRYSTSTRHEVRAVVTRQGFQPFTGTSQESLYSNALF